MQPRNWEYELKTFITLYVYWQLARKLNGELVEKEVIGEAMFLRGRSWVEGRIDYLYVELNKMFHADRFVLNGR